MTIFIFSLCLGHAFILVYSICSRQSLEELKPILELIGEVRDISSIEEEKAWIEEISVTGLTLLRVTGKGQKYVLCKICKKVKEMGIYSFSPLWKS